MSNFDEDARGLVGAAETIVSMGTGYAGLIGSGFAGIANLIATGDWDSASKKIDEVQEMMTYQPRTYAGKQINQAIGEKVEQGLSAIENVPESRGGQIAARTAAEMTLGLLPFMPKMIRGVKAGVNNAKLRAEAEQAAIAAKQAVIDNKKFSMPEGLYEKISRRVDETQAVKPTPKPDVPPVTQQQIPSATQPANSLVTRPNFQTELVARPNYQAELVARPGVKPAPKQPAPAPQPQPLATPLKPRRSFLGDAIDSPVLRAEQRFPGSTMKLELRRMEADRAWKQSVYDPIVEELHTASRKLSSGKRNELQEAWLKQDKARVQQLTEESLGKQRSDKLWSEYDAAIKTRFQEMKDAGIKVEELPDYLPRMVADYNKYKQYAPPESLKRLADLEEKLRTKQITPAEFSMQLNKDITSGGTPFIKRPSTRHSKERASYRAHKDSFDAYATPEQALRNYFNETGSAIAERNFLGMGKNIDESIGAKVVAEKQAGRIAVADARALNSRDPKVRAEAVKRAIDQEADYRKILQARFAGEAQSAPNKFISTAKDIGYAGTIAQLSSAATQIADVMGAFGKQGVGSSAKAVFQAALPRRLRKRTGTIEPTDVGVGDIMQEMIGTPSRTKAILDGLLRVSGFKMVDRFGKRVVLNAARNKFKRWAKTKEGIKKLEEIGYKNVLERTGEWDQFVTDLSKGDMNNPNVRWAIVNELAEVQPIFMSDMPILYLRHPNGRIVYSLKTWAIRQLNRMREDVMNKKYGDALKYGGAIYLGTMSVDLTKKWLESLATGKDLTQEDVEDMALNNLLKMGLTNRYQIEKAGSQGLWDAAMQQMEPPALGIIDNIKHDIIAWIKHRNDPWGTDEPKIRSISNAPIGGRMFEPFVNRE